ncbi:unnamed protein product [Parnassius mnemosyne]|uniref:Uncharacterized protein n=1 Tax=Parnassius mnemosyne TaxID=213953 RepID=A0AAV1KIM5_9NEOP
METVIFILVVAIDTTIGMFFHEPSFIQIKPSDEIDQMAFGFSMAYQRPRKLVIGAPHSDLNGRVYTCSIEDIIKNNSVCSQAEIDVEQLANEYTREMNPNQHYCLGASIAATSNYFLTCAPLWMSSYKKTKPKQFEGIETSSYGTCFIYNGTAHRYEGMYEQCVKHRIDNRQAFSGGVGWTTLVDEVNNLILIAKLFPKGDIAYISITNPLHPARSIVQNKLAYFAKHTDYAQTVGYALASGTFSVSGVNKTIYAYSIGYYDMTGSISFLEYNKPRNSLRNLKTDIKYESINTMFGAAMLGVDLNLDGYSELVVGVPAQSGDGVEAYEIGALEIYTGGNLNTIGDINRRRSILGNNVGSRFGSAIASTDVDGDGYPEIIVSAPYEDNGLGAIYIISGFELNKMLLRDEFFKSISLSQLVLTQRIQSTLFRSFGFSLQVVDDMDENGRDELAVGCPESARVILYRGISTVKVAVSAQLVGEQVVRIKHNSFTVRVTVEITYPKKPKEIIGKLKLINTIIGNGLQIRKGQDIYVINLSHKETKSEIDVIVDIDDNEPGSYKFTTSVELATEDAFHNKDFNPSWVTLSLHSETRSASLAIERRCSGESCLPRLNMTLEWSGSKPYHLGSTKSETVTIRVKNHGNNSYAQACAYVKISGAQVGRVGCAETAGRYKCFLPVPIRRDAEHLIEILLDMSKPTNKDQKLIVDVEFYNSSCSLQSNFTRLGLEVPFALETEAVVVNGSSHDRIITDSDVLDMNIKTVEDAQEYMIENNGASLWKDVYAVVTWQHQQFIESYKVSLTSTISDCVRQDTEKGVSFNCTFNLEPHTVVKIIPTTTIIEESVEKNLIGDQVNITSSLVFHLPPTEARKELKLTTLIQYRRVLSVGQNKNIIILIAIIVAIIILALVTYILYKIGFFKRETKRKLIEEKKDDERRKSLRRSMIERSEDNDTQADNGTENFGMEVVDEPLRPQAEILPAASDQSNLIKCEAEVH